LSLSLTTSFNWWWKEPAKPEPFQGFTKKKGQSATDNIIKNETLKIHIKSPYRHHHISDPDCDDRH
jgi:hypothetical protein